MGCLHIAEGDLMAPQVTGKKIASGRSALGPPPEQRRIIGAGHRLISYRELKEVFGVPYSRVHLRRMETAGLFPQHVTLGEGDTPYVAWIESEIIAWIEERAARRRSAGPAAAASAISRAAP
jgi:prophage regulatory protein